MADESIFISCAMTLAVFNVSKCEEDGQVIEPIVDQTTGTIRYDSQHTGSSSITVTYTFQSPDRI